MGSILIADGHSRMRDDLAAYITGRGHQVEIVANATEIPISLARRHFDLVLADVELGGSGGVALLREIRRCQPETPVILITDHADVADAVEAMRAGAYDYLPKPLSPRQVEGLLRHAIAAPTSPDDGLARNDHPPLLESANSNMAAAIATARRVAESDVPLLLRGESGTGKRTLAAAIHGWSTRRAAPFVTVWTTALTPRVAESGLLQHLDGALSSAGRDGRLPAVDGGTLFFDEVGNDHLSPALQVRLLHLLERQHVADGPHGTAALDVDARVIAASEHDLEVEVSTGQFRQDLFFRLNVVTVHLPPLRERREDLAQLGDHLLSQVAAQHGRGALRLTSDAQDVLAQYDWPGNIGELVSVLERAAVVSHGKAIGLRDLPPRIVRPASPAPAPSELLSLEAAEQRQIELALSESATLAEAAGRLGIDPATLWRRRKRYGWGLRRRSPARAKSI